MTITLDVRSRTSTQAEQADRAPYERTGRIVLYGDLTCPWSYLASRRAALLEAGGVEVDWRMVEHDRRLPGRRRDDTARAEATRRDLDRVTGRLLPGEALPHSFGDFVPDTRPAVSGYAEAYLAGVGRDVRMLLFEAFWAHGVDLGDARLVRSLLADTVRTGTSSSELLRDWGYAVDVTGAPVTTAAWLLVRDWRADWSSGSPIVPILVLESGRRLNGVDAVEWLGAEAVRRRIPFSSGNLPQQPGKPLEAALVDRYWAAEHGNRWMRARRDAKAGDRYADVRPWL